MDSYSLITRKGVLNVKGKSTSNQCAKEKHEIYEYELKVLFKKSVKLNQNGWIIDHQLLDDAVQKTVVNSCEIMSKKILDNVESVLSSNNLVCVGIKLKIQPKYVIEQISAFFQEHRCATKKDLPIIISM